METQLSHCGIMIHREQNLVKFDWILAGVHANSPPCPARRCSLRVRLKTSSRIAELSQHEADGGEFQEGKTAAVEIFPVLGETAAAVEPSDRTLDDPTLG